MTGRLSSARDAAMLCYAVLAAGGMPAARALLAEMARLADGGGRGVGGPARGTRVERLVADASEGLMPSWARRRDTEAAALVVAEVERLVGVAREPEVWLAAALGDFVRNARPTHPGARLLLALQCRSWCWEAAASIDGESWPVAA